MSAASVALVQLRLEAFCLKAQLLQVAHFSIAWQKTSINEQDQNISFTAAASESVHQGAWTTVLLAW